MWLIKFKQKGITFTSDYSRATFMDFRQKNPDQQFKLIPQEKVSREKRGFYYAGIIPAYAQWAENYDRKNKDDIMEIHELFKCAFNGETVKGLQGKPVRISHSTTHMNNKEYGLYIDRIEKYFEENQISFPCPDLYKLYVDKFQDEYKSFYDYLEKNNMKVDGAPITL